MCANRPGAVAAMTGRQHNISAASRSVQRRINLAMPTDRETASFFNERDGNETTLETGSRNRRSRSCWLPVRQRQQATPWRIAMRDSYRAHVWVDGTAATSGAGNQSGAWQQPRQQHERQPAERPSNSLSRREIFYDYDSFVVKDEYKPLLRPTPPISRATATRVDGRRQHRRARQP